MLPFLRTQHHIISGSSEALSTERSTESIISEQCGLLDFSTRGSTQPGAYSPGEGLAEMSVQMTLS